MSADKPEPAQPNHAAAKPIKLLLVDDEKGYVDVLSNRLSRRRIHVTKTYSGEEAIQAVRGRDFDVAVLDLKMEDMNGLEVLKIFRKMDPKLVVIMLTGHGSEEAAREGIAAGAFDYLTKPCELDDLLAEREKINTELQEILDTHTDPWGIKVATVELKHIDLPSEMQRAIARQAEAERERRAKVINAEGEYQAATKLAEASEIIEKHPTALQLRYLQTMNEMSTESNSTMIFPIPIELFKPFTRLFEKMDKE